MPEVIAIVFVVLVSLGMALFAVIYVAKTESTEAVPAKLDEWKARLAWADERLEKARRENWDHDMTARLLARQKTAATRVRSLEQQHVLANASAPKADTTIAS